MVAVVRLLRWYVSLVVAHLSCHCKSWYVYEFIACCCCAAAAGVDFSSSAYPGAVLSHLHPWLILPYLHLSPIAGIHGAAADYDVPVCIQIAAAATTAAAVLCVAIVMLLLLLADAVRHRIPATRGMFFVQNKQHHQWYSLSTFFFNTNENSFLVHPLAAHSFWCRLGLSILCLSWPLQERAEPPAGLKSGPCM